MKCFDFTLATSFMVVQSHSCIILHDLNDLIGTLTFQHMLDRYFPRHFLIEAKQRLAKRKEKTFHSWDQTHNYRIGILVSYPIGHQGSWVLHE